MIKLELAYNSSKEINQLFSAYTNMLTEKSSEVAAYLKLQNYYSEIEHLEEKYGLPEGRLYIIRVDKKAAGCIGLRKLDDKNCEMKRLYVYPEYRGNKLSDILMRKIIADAKEIGYKSIFLDTLPFLQSAVYLYKKYGFYEIDSYNNSPIDTTIYMKLDLTEE